MPPDPDNDAQLCARAAAGDRGAFSVLVARHENRLRAFLRHVGGADVADELAQESFLKAWQAARQFRGEASFASWLSAIGWRCYVDHVRRSRSRTRTDEAAAEFAQGAGAAEGEGRIDLARALGSLEPAERAALVLCDGHGWSHIEAAAILRLPLGTVKTLVRRAKQKCRILLRQEDERD